MNQTRRSLALRGGPLIALSAVAGMVLYLLARSALDVVAVLLLCATIVLLERTLGDWFAERLGPFGGNVLFVALVVALLWGLLSTNPGKEATMTVLQVGSDRGFESAFVSVGAPGLRPSTQAAGGRLPTQPAARKPTPVRASPESTVPRGGVNQQARAIRDGNGTKPKAANTRVIVRALPSDEPRQIVLQAEVLAGPDPVTDGMVEFSLNGRVVAQVPLRSGGGAEARMANLAPGYYRVRARFAGTADYRESTSEIDFTI